MTGKKNLLLIAGIFLTRSFASSSRSAFRVPKKIKHFVELAAGKCIICPFPILFCFYQAALAKHLHVMGKGGLRDIQTFQDFATAKRTAPQHFKYLHTGIICQCL